MIVRTLALWLVVLSGLLLSTARAERAVVLVTGESCPMESLSMLDVRKAFLGWNVRFEGHVVHALRLNTDNELKQIFLQSVVAMSERTYERRLASQALKYGTPRPREYGTVEQLAAEIARSDCAIGYMWREDAEAIPAIKSIRVLWQSD